MKTCLKSFVPALVAAMIGSFAGCKSDDVTSEIPDEPTEIQLNLPAVDTFYEVETLGGDWTVTDYPDWAGPLSCSGTSGASIVLFVESNEDGVDRVGDVVVHYESQGDVIYKVKQIGSDENGSESAELSSLSNVLEYTRGVGYAVNVFRQSSSAKYYVVDSSPISFSKLTTVLNQIGEPDAVMDEDRYYSTFESVVGTSTSALSNQLSINAGIEVGISGFKFSVEAGYETNTTGDHQYEYAIEEIQHIVKDRRIRPGVLRYSVEKGYDIFTDSFNKLCEAFKKSPTDAGIMSKLLEKYGTHIITHGSLGGELKLSMQLDVTNSSSSNDIYAAVCVGNKIVNVTGEMDISNAESAIASNTTISLVTYGGDNVYTVSPGETFANFLAKIKDPQKMKQWVTAFQNGTSSSVALIDVELMPIYELMPTEELKNNLRAYMIGPYQKSYYAKNDQTYTGPDLYLLMGFSEPPTYNSTVTKSVTIPEIDEEVWARWEKIPEIDPDNNIIAIYSGAINKVTTNSGFFIGSSTLKPCKFKRTKNGKFTKQEFEYLSAGTIEELYVDASGDVTIVPQSVEDLYQTKTFPAWPADKGSTSGGTDNTGGSGTSGGSGSGSGTTGSENKNVTISNFRNGYMVVEGGIHTTLKNGTASQIYCQNGANLTLDGVKAESLQCEGSVTITLADGSSNEMPIACGSGNLIIQGNGSLKSVADFCAAIGCPQMEVCGNIEIKGGNIYAESYMNGAAIGCTDISTCGDIILSGGSIEAYNLFQSAAIGTSGYGCSCGTIRIKSTVTKVEVSAPFAKNIIGAASDEDQCGAVIIEDPRKVSYY